MIYEDKTIELEENEKPKVYAVRFTSEEKDTIIVTNELLNADIWSWNPDLPECQDLIEQGWNEEKIEEATLIFIRNETKQRERFEQFLELEENFYVGTLKTEHILKASISENDLFKLKMSVFELEEVKNNKDRLIKSKIRKSKDPVEIFALLHKIRTDSESESS